MTSFFVTGRRERVLDDLQNKIQGRLVLVATGQCICPGGTRIGVMRINRGRASLLWSGHVDTDDIEVLRARLAKTARAVWSGGLDFYHATPWSLAWSSGEAPFRLFSRWNGLLCAVDGHVVTLRRPLGILPVCGAAATLNLSCVDHVRVSVSANWTTTSVEMVLRDSTIRTLASARSVGPEIDPTYDGLDLMGDAMWAESLGRALAAACGVGLRLDEALGGDEWRPAVDPPGGSADVPS